MKFLHPGAEEINLDTYVSQPELLYYYQERTVCHDGVWMNPAPKLEWKPHPVLSEGMKRQARKQKEKWLRDNERLGKI